MAGAYLIVRLELAENKAFDELEQELAFLSSDIDDEIRKVLDPRYEIVNDITTVDLREV